FLVTGLNFGQVTQHDGRALLDRREDLPSRRIDGPALPINGNDSTRISLQISRQRRGYIRPMHVSPAALPRRARRLAQPAPLHGLPFRLSAAAIVAPTVRAFARATSSGRWA